jgi:5-hydroxyisourate hydrolase
MSKHDDGRRDFLHAGIALGAASLLALQPAAASNEKPAKKSPPQGAKPGVSGPGRITFHAIDTHHGSTVGSLHVELRRLEGGEYKTIKTFDTVKNGRSDGAVIEGADFASGKFELLLHLDDYFAELGTALPSPSFLSKVPLRFGIHDARQRYHIAVLFSPWSYSYYRGS